MQSYRTTSAGLALSAVIVTLFMMLPSGSVAGALHVVGSTPAHAPAQSPLVSVAVSRSSPLFSPTAVPWPGDLSQVPAASLPHSGPAGAPYLWSNLSAISHTQGPSSRASAGMAWDAADGYLVVFGGENYSKATGYAPQGDTWTYKDGVWSNITSQSPTAPSPRRWIQMAYDPSDHVVLLFGGSSKTTFALADTWTFHAGIWTNITSSLTLSPPGVNSGTLETDSADNEVLLFGGENVTGVILGETWVFQHMAWKDLAPLSSAPSPRIYAQASDDPADHGVLLFSGYPTSTIPYPDTWLFRNNSWTNLTSSLSPSPSGVWGGAAFFVAGSQSVLLTAGVGASAWNLDVWAYHNRTWTNVSAQVYGTPFQGIIPSSGELGQGPSQTGVLFGGGQEPSPINGGLWAVTTPIAVRATFGPGAIDNGTRVNFSGQYSGGFYPTSFVWSFGDGTSTSSLSSGTQLYRTPGTYVANFSASDFLGYVASESFSVTVNPALSSTATATALTLDAGMSTSFQAQAVGGTGPFTYKWSFGDASLGSSAQDPTHTYTASGPYRATVNVTDASALVSQSHVDLQVNPDPTVNETVSAHSGMTAQALNFTSAPTGGTAPFTYLWNFGDGSGSTAASPHHAFVGAGTYYVNLTVTDAVGARATNSTTVTVAASPAPLSSQTSASPGGALVNRTFTFTGRASGGTGPYTYAWNFGDSVTGSGATATHAYLKVGNYTVTLTVTDAKGATSTATIVVTVFALPAPISSSSSGWPMSALLAVIALAALVVVLGALYATKGRKPRTPAPAQPAPPQLAPVSPQGPGVPGGPGPQQPPLPPPSNPQ